MMSIISRRGKRREGDFEPLADLRSEMDRLLGSLMRSSWGTSVSDMLGNARGWYPPVDVAEGKDELTVRAEVPGVDASDLEITVLGNQLTLAGERKECGEQDAALVHRECHRGAFRRTIDLTSDVDAGQVTAECANGIVTIKLRKTKAAASQRIPIKTA